MINVHNDIFTVDQDCLRHPMYIDRLINVPNRKYTRKRLNIRPTAADGVRDQTYEMHKLLSRRGNDSNREYLVQWYGYGMKDSMLEPALNIYVKMYGRYDRRTQRPERNNSLRRSELVN